MIQTIFTCKLQVPDAKTFKGPATLRGGYVPVYVANGTQFYLVSVGVFLLLAFLFPGFCLDVYNDFPSILAVLNVTALGLCWYIVVVKPKASPEDPNDCEDHGGNLAVAFFKGRNCLFPFCFVSICKTIQANQTQYNIFG